MNLDKGQKVTAECERDLSFAVLDLLDTGIPLVGVASVLRSILNALVEHGKEGVQYIQDASSECLRRGGTHEAKKRIEEEWAERRRKLRVITNEEIAEEMDRFLEKKQQSKSKSECKKLFNVTASVDPPNRVSAIQWYRRETNAGLKEASDWAKKIHVLSLFGPVSQQQVDKWRDYYPPEVKFEVIEA